MHACNPHISAGVLRQLSGTRSFLNFVHAKGAASATAAQRKLSHCSSALQNDIRPRTGARQSGAWQREDWVEVRFCSREMGAQQLRRMAGVLVAVVRGVEGEEV